MAQTSLTLFGPFGTPITPKVSKGFNTLYLFQKNIILETSLVVSGSWLTYSGAQPICFSNCQLLGSYP